MSDELPRGWEARPVRDLIEDFQPGFASGEKAVDGGVAHLRMNNIGLLGELVLDLIRTVPPVLAKERHHLQRGDVLVCTTNSGKLVGKSAYFDLPGRYAFSNHLTRLRPKAGLVNGRFLRWSLWLEWKRGGFDDKCKHWVNQSTLPKDALLGTTIILPPLAEQRRIVAKLEEVLGKVDASRARLAKIPTLLKRFRQSVLAAACSGRLTTDWREDNPTAEPYPCETIEVDEELPANWRATNLGRLTTLVTSGSRGWAKYYAESGSTFIRAQNINSDYLDMDDIAYVRPPAGAEGLRTRVRQHDLLVTITGANVTKSALVEQPIEDAYISQHVALARLNDIRLSKFVFQSLICPSHGRKQLLAAAYGQGKPGLNLENIRDVIVHLPPMAEQQEIVRRVEVLFALADKIEARFKRAQARVEQLTTALLAQAFRGELVPQDPADEPASVLLERIRQKKGGISDPALQQPAYPEPTSRELKVAEPRRRKRQ
jgi:type I restriction enzyme S subunit